MLYFQVSNTQLCFQFLTASGKHLFYSITPAGNQIVSPAPGLCHDHQNMCHSSCTCSSSSILDMWDLHSSARFWNTVRFVLGYVSAWACEVQEILGEGIIFGENTRRNACSISKNSRFKHPISPVFFFFFLAQSLKEAIAPQERLIHRDLLETMSHFYWE